MMSTQRTAPVSSPPEAAPPRGQREAGGSTDFLDLLAQTTARTAQPEGQESTTAAPVAEPPRAGQPSDPAAPGAAAPTSQPSGVPAEPAAPVVVPPAQATVPAQPDAAGLAAVPAPSTDAAQAAAASPAATDPAAGQAAGASQAAGTDGATLASAASSAAPADTTAALQADPAAAQAEPVPAEQSSGAAAGQDSAEQDSADQDAHNPARGAVPAPGANGGNTEGRQATEAAPAARPDAAAAPAATSPATDDDATVAAARAASAGTQPAGREAEPAATRGPNAHAEARVPDPAPQPAQSPARSAEAARPAPVRSVPLSRAVETIEATLRVATQRGVSHARLQLNPAELGAVEVSLRGTAEGIVATVRADAAQAASVLQQAGAELRRSLEDAGVRVLELDIGWSGTESRGDADGSGERPSARGSAGPGAAGAGLAGDTDIPETVLELPNGVLVDVIA
jgi:flagellar hook-length control protein FliK